MSNKPIGYWCPLCGDLKEISNPFPWIDGKAFHHGHCPGLFIPVYRRLDVPEVTTWGESGGYHAITTSGAFGIIFALGGRETRLIWSNVDCEGWDMAEQINYVAGAK